MATLLLDAPTHDHAAPPGATLKVLLSPVRGADGQWRVVTQGMPVGVPIGEVLPRGQVWNRIICNGRVLDPDEYATYLVQPEDELLAIPQWGDPVLTPLLITFAIGIAVSIATTALSYLLFPRPSRISRAGRLTSQPLALRGSGPPSAPATSCPSSMAGTAWGDNCSVRRSRRP